MGIDEVFQLRWVIGLRRCECEHASGILLELGDEECSATVDLAEKGLIGFDMADGVISRRICVVAAKGECRYQPHFRPLSTCGFLIVPSIHRQLKPTTNQTIVIEKMRLEHPIAGKIQQGAIFNCVALEGYEACKCYGLVLTARCDLEHNKYSAINYLPIVRFTDWLPRGFSYLLARRMVAELGKEVSEMLRKKNVSFLVRETFPLTDIIQKEFPPKEQQPVLKKVEQLETAKLVAALNGQRYQNSAEWIKSAGKRSSGLVEDLIQQKLSEYYFLQAVDLYRQDEEGYVVLLRHMRTIDCETGQHIVRGVDADEAQALQDFTFQHEPIAMITGVLRSPDIEHLAQQFSQLFTRIGLEDQPARVINQHLALAAVQ